MIKPLTSYVYFTLSAAVLLSPFCLSATEKEDSMTASFFPYAGGSSKNSEAEIQPLEEAAAEEAAIVVPETPAEAVISIEPLATIPAPASKNNSSNKNNSDDIAERRTQHGCHPDVRSHSIYFKHIEAKGIGYKQGYSTVGAFMAPYSFYSGWLPFVDLRAHVFNNWRKAANAGLGVRYLTDCDYVFGLGAYYDYRQTHRFHYNQASLGLEWLGHRFEARLNGYLPFGRKTHRVKHSQAVSFNFDHFAGHNLYYNTTNAVKEKLEFAMYGGDAEFGWHLMQPRENFTVYAGVGPYYYRQPQGHHARHAFGGKIRVEARVTPCFVFEVSDSYDNLFKNNLQGQATFKIPFGVKLKKKKRNSNNTCSDILAMEGRMVQPMYRQEIIVSSKQKRSYTTTSDPIAVSVLGTPLNIQFVNNTSSGGNGTFESPYNTLAAASTASTKGDVFYVAPGDGTTTGLNAGITLLEDQQLLSSSVPQQVSILVNSTVQTVNIPAFTTTLPSLSNAAAAVVIMAGSNTVVSGFAITPSASFAAITATGAVTQFDNITIKNNNISLTGAGTPGGIICTSIAGSNVIANNTITNSATTGSGSAIVFDIDSDLISNLALQNNFVAGASAASVYTNPPIIVRTNNGAGSAELNAIVSGNTITTLTAGVMPEPALLISSLNQGQTYATVMNNTITNITGDGMSFSSAAIGGLVNAAVSNNTVTNCTGDGIILSALTQSSQSIGITNNTISNTSNAITTDGGMPAGNVNYFIQGNKITLNTGSSINLDTFDADAHITIDSNLLFNNAGGVNVLNDTTGTICLRLTNNTNTHNYTITNNNTTVMTPVNILLEPTTGNTGNIILLQGAMGTGGFTIVEPGTCAP